MVDFLLVVLPDAGNARVGLVVYVKARHRQIPDYGVRRCKGKPVRKTRWVCEQHFVFGTMLKGAKYLGSFIAANVAVYHCVLDTSMSQYWRQTLYSMDEWGKD